MIANTIGIGIIAMDRPHYLRRLVASLAQQKGAGAVEFHLFQDGIDNAFSGRTVANHRDWQQVYNFFDSCKLEPRWIHSNGENLGPALHQYQGTEYMARRYDYIMMMEDDVVLSPYWLRLLRVLFGQFDGDGVFGFCPGFKRLGGLGNLGALRYVNEYWWCEAFTARAWRWVDLEYQSYLNLVRGIDYKARDSDAIRELFKAKEWTNPSTSQDSGKDMAIQCAGMRRVVCESNRAIGIGTNGIHFNPAIFARSGYRGQTPYIHTEDLTRDSFDDPIDA